MSKGSSRRPAAVPRATVDANYERTFRVDQRSGGAVMSRDMYDDLQAHINSLPEAQWIAPSSDRTDAP